jgi:hypothetical protein
MPSNNAHFFLAVILSVSRLLNYQPTKDRAKKPRKASAPAHTAYPEGQASDVKGTSLSPQPTLVPESIASVADTWSLRIPPPDPISRSQLEPQSDPLPTTAPPNTTGRITGRWTEPTLIGVKPIPSQILAASKPPPDQKPQGMVGRRALPGLVATLETAEKGKEKLPHRDRSVSPSPTKHNRIPSTGNRATVMDVAQALSEAQQGNDPTPGTPPRILPLSSQTEKRKPSFEKYSSFVMPPLKEERTPVPSPAGTLAKSSGNVLLDSKLVNESPQSSLRVDAATHHAQLSSPLTPEVVHIGQQTYIVRPRVIADSSHLTEYEDEPLPKVDVDTLLKYAPSTFIADPKIHTVSVEILSINDGNATPVIRDSHIFYDTEALAIVHRVKSRESGLVSTKVWCWHGKKCQFGEREEKKAGELARRYGSALVSIRLQERD